MMLSKMAGGKDNDIRKSTTQRAFLDLKIAVLKNAHCYIEDGVIRASLHVWQDSSASWSRLVALNDAVDEC